MMGSIIEGFGILLGYVFLLQVAGIIWDRVIRAFEGRGL